MIHTVGDTESSYAEIPSRFEAGTPNVGGAVGLRAAIDYLESLGMGEVRRHEVKLVELAFDALSGVEGVKVYGPRQGRSGVVSFSVDGIHPHDLATILDDRQVAIRAGHHCAQPLMRRLNVQATARASFYVYNDESDVEALKDGVLRAIKMFAVTG